VAKNARIYIAITALLFAACDESEKPVADFPADIAPLIEEGARKNRTLEEDEKEIEVGTITVLNQTALPASDFFAPLVNFFHSVTRRDVIADELNFKTGDKIKRWELYDAERYIRLLDPVKQARIVEKPKAETGKTDLIVMTRDRLSAYVRGGGSGSGGYSSFGISAGDSSLFGRLISVGGSYERENFRDFVGLSASKLRIAGTRWQAGVASLEGFSAGYHNYYSRSVAIGHPFTVDGQRHGFSLSAGISEGVGYEYLGGGIRSGRDPVTGSSFGLIYRMRSETFAAEYLHGIGKKHRIEFGPGFQHYVRQDNFISPNDQYTLSATPELGVSNAAKTIYQNEQFATHAVSFAINTRNGDFVPMVNFRKYLFAEDHFEGFRTANKITHADPALGLSDHYTRGATTWSYQTNFDQKKYRIETAIARSATFWHSRYEIARDDLWAFDVKGFMFTRYGTLALREYAAGGANLSISARNQIAAEFTRGFYYGSLSLQSGYLSSLEYRSPYVKMPYILLAGVAFFDYAGIGNSFSNMQWYPIVGLGLRTMLWEFDNNVFRLDLGINLRDANFNLLNSLQFGLSQTF